MEMIDMMYELATSKVALESMNGQMRKLRGKCMRRNLVIAGLVWFGLTACELLSKSDKKLKEAEEHNRNLEVQLAHEQQTVEKLKNLWMDPNDEAPTKDICCDGKASIDKKEV